MKPGISTHDNMPDGYNCSFIAVNAVFVELMSTAVLWQRVIVCGVL